MHVSILWAAVAVLGLPGSAQALTIYEEMFTGQSGYGVTGDGGTGTLDTGNGESWTISSNADGSGSDFSGLDSSDYFRVSSDAMTARDLDQVVYWFSPVRSIAGYTNLVLSGLFTQTGDIEGGTGVNADFIDVAFSLDGGATFNLIADINGFGTGSRSLTGNTGPGGTDWGSTILSEGLADGTAFQLRIALQNSANDEYLAFDNILLTGDEITGVPLPASGLLLAGAVVLLRRHRRAA